MRSRQCIFDLASAPATTPMKPTIIAATAARNKARASGHQLYITCVSKLSYKARMSLLVLCQDKKNHGRNSSWHSKGICICLLAPAQQAPYFQGVQAAGSCLILGTWDAHW